MSDSKLLKDIIDLKFHCFEIEGRLPWNHESWKTEDTDAQAIRRELYNVRCKLGEIANRTKLWGVKYD